jgi:hypothetical protein
MKRTSIAMIMASMIPSLFLAAGCNVTSPSQEGSGVVCFWISSDRDTYASFGRVGEDVDRNFGPSGFVAVANGPLGIKHSYVQFTPPSFPEGTEILEAKLELFHSGKNEDGTTDDVNFNVAVIRNEAWSPLTLTWANRPDRDGLPGVDAELRLRSQNWSGTPDISGIVREMIDSSTVHHGFLVWYRDPSGRQVEKGFYSNNDVRRKQNDLGLAPRLLIRVRLPEGKTVADVKLPPFLAADTDITLARPITMLQTRQSATWPTDWNVSP